VIVWLGLHGGTTDEAVEICSSEIMYLRVEDGGPERTGASRAGV